MRAVRAALAWGADALVLPFGRTRPGRRLALALRAAAERRIPVLAAGGPARTELRGSSAAVVLAAGVRALHLADERSQTRDGLGEADEGDQVRRA